MPNSIPIMLQVGTVMTPIIVYEDTSYTQLLDIVSTYLGPERNLCGQSLRAFWARWECHDQQSTFPERTRIDDKNIGATIALMMLRSGRDVLEADYHSDSSLGVYA
jgi:hypothetical protein